MQFLTEKIKEIPQSHEKTWPALEFKAVLINNPKIV